MGIKIRSLDLVVIIIYLIGITVMGLYFSRRNTSTEEYFVGSRSFPGWAIGLSMLGTSISAVTFLAFPADAYQGNWVRLVPNLMLPFVAVIAIFIFIPFFRRGQLTSAFEYLGVRFGPMVRLYGTISFILLQLIRLATILCLVSIPVSLLTQIELQYVIVATGIFIAFYTVVGGFDAVIWTDVIQSIVLWFGGLLCFGFIVWNLPEGMSQIFSVGWAHDKFHFGSTAFTTSRDTIWAVALIGILNWLAMYSSDQNVVQRYVATKSTAAARYATTLYSLVAVPTWAFFFFIGTCVFVWYQAFPDERVLQMEAEQVFPHFILTQVPAGFAGLILAGALAAAMSSLDSSINAIATVATVDLLKPYLARERDDLFYLRTARWIATAAAAVMILGALLVSATEKESINDFNWIMTSIFGGCLVGLFMIGFFTRRVDNSSAVLALVISILLNFYLGLNSASWLPSAYTIVIEKYWIGVIVNVVFVACALSFSLFRTQRRDLKGLTVWTMGDGERN